MSLVILFRTLVKSFFNSNVSTSVRDKIIKMLPSHTGLFKNVLSFRTFFQEGHIPLSRPPSPPSLWLHYHVVWLTPLCYPLTTISGSATASCIGICAYVVRLEPGKNSTATGMLETLVSPWAGCWVLELFQLRSQQPFY